MSSQKNNKIAVVTGANRGLGLVIARNLAARGFITVAVCRGKDKAQHAAKQIGCNNVVGYAADVSNPADVLALAGYIEKEFGQLDVLINNAGVIAEGSVENVGSVESCVVNRVAETININAIGAYRVTTALLQLLKKAPAGRIVNVSSELGSLANMGAGLPGYRMSKAALNALTRTLAAELGDNSSLKVNSISPGWVRTDMGGSNATRGLEEGADSIIWAALLKEDGPTGGFFRDGEVLPW